MEFPLEIINMLSVQETDVLSSNLPASEQLKNVTNNLKNAPSDYNKIFNPGATSRTSGAQDHTTINQRSTTSYSSAAPKPQRPPLLETPCNPFESRSSNLNTGAIPKKSRNAEFRVNTSDPTNPRPFSSETQPSKLNPHLTKAQSSKSNLQAINTQACKLDSQDTKNQSRYKTLKPHPPRPLSPNTQELVTRNSFAILDDLDLGDDSPHDYSQQQMNLETNIPYSQGSNFFDYQFHRCR